MNWRHLPTILEKNTRQTWDIWFTQSHSYYKTKIGKFAIFKTINKHYEEIINCEKVTSLKLKNRVGVIHDNEWTSGVVYEGEDNQETENEDYIEEDQ